MSSDHSDAIKVSPEELYEPSPAVQVDDVEGAFYLLALA
jgi:hypothetical protein